jgi:hypothetical protein
MLIVLLILNYRNEIGNGAGRIISGNISSKKRNPYKNMGFKAKHSLV